MSENKRAIIFGATGQDGSYLSSFLLDKVYEVVAVTRRTSTDNTQRLGAVKEADGFELVEGDLLDPSSVSQIINYSQPDEIYNLAAQSHVGTSFKQPSFTFQVNAVGVLNILEAVRNTSPHSKVYQASTSEMFGDNFTTYPTEADEIITESVYLHDDPKFQKFQNEETAFAPRSPYAVAKMAAHNLCHTYRESYDVFTSCGILFNHESELRGKEFVTRKITGYVSTLVTKAYHEMGRKEPIFHTKGPDEVEHLGLGNLDARRDWGHAEDYVRAMWLMLQQDKPDDYVISTGKTYSVRQFLDAAFGYVGIADWEPYVYQDERFFRPAEVEYLLGNSDKAKRELGWEPEVTFQQLVERMIDYDIASSDA